MRNGLQTRKVILKKMSKGKPRLYLDKPQNNLPEICPRYEKIGNIEYCKGCDWRAAIYCGGNPHNCKKVTYRYSASGGKAEE